MLDFLMVCTKIPKRGTVEIFPKFIVKSSSDLMIRGGDFYAIWNEDAHLWMTDEGAAVQMIDKALDQYYEEHKEEFRDSYVKILHMWDSDSGTIDRWHKYVQKQTWDSYHNLDEELVFSNMDSVKETYASKRLPYPLEQGELSAYNKLMSVLYSEEERHKIEWAIGSIVSGESKYVQKFIVLYGGPGTGKSTVLNIIQDLFEGYYSVFDAKALGQATNAFALEAFKSNPLVAIQHDGDLSRIEDNTRLNSVVSHELMTVNEKFKSEYSNRFNCFLFMGTNKPVKITDAKSGILRRLIDVTPTGNKLSPAEYKSITKQIKFELGAISWHCKQVYETSPGAYDDYIPTMMLNASNDFYNFMLDAFDVFQEHDSTTLSAAYAMYDTYCKDSNFLYPLNTRQFKEELKNYFEEFYDRKTLDDGTRVRNYFSGFLSTKFEYEPAKINQPAPKVLDTLGLHPSVTSIFDDYCKECPAQYATAQETPIHKWSEVTSTLEEIDPTVLHYVKVPENHIIIDFDLKDKNGEKDLQANIEAASQWPATYAELSKSGKGVHLHYIYTGGDPKKLSRIYDENIEVKVYSGKSSLRRKLTQCNDTPIANINSGLSLKEDVTVVNDKAIKSERGLRTMIKRNLNKEIHGYTRPSIDFIDKILSDAYESGMKYDVTDMRPSILSFAAQSHNQAEYCIKTVNKMKFKSEEPSVSIESYSDNALYFYDVEVFPNLFLINWKREGDNPVIRMINPGPQDVERLIKYKLVGFNCRRYDNHILYACLMGYSNYQLYQLSQRIVSGSPNCMFSEAYNLSYTDVYDFSSVKQSLKKFEIDLGIHHEELGLPWDQPVPEELWPKVAEYCDNDVIATEAVFNARKGDFIAREILADVAGMTVNDTTNTLTTKIIFGNERHPQNRFNYRDLAEPCSIDEDMYEFLNKACPEMVELTHGDAGSMLPYFEGYKYENGQNLYRGIDVGKGGYVYANPGMYGRTVTLDVASMHPSSIIAENLFGPYTQRFKDLLDARIAIKHKDFEKAKGMLNGALTRYLDDPDKAKALAQALKIAINSVYGLTSASFENPFKDPRNINNIVALRGALFMKTLQDEIEASGFTVVHIKTDSIKIANPTDEILKRAVDIGKKYGYNFEIEHVFEKICLVNNAVYIAKLAADDPEEPGQWTATGKQFSVPYLFKTLFTHEPIEFKDLCETKEVKTAIYVDKNEGYPDTSNWEELLDLREKVDKAAAVGKEPKLTGREKRILDEYEDLDDEAVKAKADAGHNYIFVGKVGSFCPIKKDCGGGRLVREKDGKYYSVTGATGYRWLESEMVERLGKQGDIDLKYFNDLVDEGVESISKFGDFEWFTA